MASFSALLIMAVIGIHAANGMDCSIGTSKNIIDQFIHTCPRPLIDSESESYCCWTATGDSVHCCNMTNFVFNTISLSLPIIIVLLLISFVVSCVCCLCCPCCCFYRGSKGGRVLHQGPMLVTVGPYAMPPTTPYQRLPDRQGGWTVA